MELRKLLALEHSRKNCDRVVTWIGSSQQRFDELMAYFSGPDLRLTQLAAWPMSYAVIAHPELINKHWNKLLKQLESGQAQSAFKRNSVRFMQDVDLPKRYHGRIMNLCFNFIEDPTEKVATKAFSLTVLHKLSAIYPEIKPEIRTIIETRFEHETASFRSRARKMM